MNRRQYLGAVTLGAALAVAPPRVAAQTNSYAFPEPRAPSLPSEHTMSLVVPDHLDGRQMETLALEYSATSGGFGPSEFDGDASGVGVDTVAQAGIDRDGNGQGIYQVDEGFESAIDAVDATEDAVEISLDPAVELAAGDKIVLRYHGVVNPSEGEFSIAASVDGADPVDLGIDFHRMGGALLLEQDVGADGELVVRSTYLPEGGFVVVRLRENGERRTKGVSSYLDRGGHTDVTIPLSDVLTGRHEVEVVLYRDGNDDEFFTDEFDDPYMEGGSQPIMTMGTVQVTERIPERETPTSIPQQSGDGAVGGSNQVGSDTDRTANHRSAGASGGSQRGFFSNEDPAVDNVDSFTLTVGGFLLSAAGIVHQMARGN